MIWQPIRPVRLTVDYGYNPTKIRKSIPLIDTNDNINTGPRQRGRRPGSHAEHNWR